MAGILKLTQEGIRFIGSIYEQENRPFYREIREAYNNLAVRKGWTIMKSDCSVINYTRRLGIYKPTIQKPEYNEPEIVNKPPRHGFINELARLCGCSRHTVRTAIYENASGKKADIVRKMYGMK